MGNTLHKNIDAQRKVRALTLMKMFKRKIEKGLFRVESADWWTNNMDGGVYLKIEVYVEDWEVLEDLNQS